MSDKLRGNRHDLFEAVGIVHCVDCKYLDPLRGDLVPMAGICNVVCRKGGFQFPLHEVTTSFCSWGKRKEAEQ